MLTVTRVKEILDDKNISDKEILEIRDVCQGLAELALERFQEERIKSSSKKENEYEK